MKPYKVVNNYVYVLLEHHYSPGPGKKSIDAKVHGVFTERGHAEQARHKHIINRDCIQPFNSVGYFSILKKPIKGKTRNKELAVQQTMIWDRL